MSKERLFQLFFLGLLLLLTVGFLRVFFPFFIPIALAAVFARMFYGPFIWIARKTGSRTLSGILVCIAIILLVFIPVSLLGAMITAEAIEGITRLKLSWPEIVKNADSSWAILLSKNSWLGGILPAGSDSLEKNLIAYFEQASGFMFDFLSSMFVSGLKLLFDFLIVLYLMFFFLTEGHILVRSIQRYLPFDDNEEEELFTEVMRTADAALWGTVFIGLLEGILGGFIFYFAGFPSPLLWGSVMVVLSMLPILGINTLIIPVAIFTLIQGNILTALLILVFAIAGTSVTQFLIKPKFIGIKSGLHPAVVVLSTLGGMAWLGAPGFLIGPFMAAIFIAGWRQFARKYKEEKAAKPA